LYGNYISGFCGGLTVGDWHDLPELLRDYREARYPRLIARLIQSGPAGLLELGASEYGFVPSPDGYAGKCHLCVDIRRVLARSGDFPELRPQEFYDRF
jgi:hypothetical protein